MNREHRMPQSSPNLPKQQQVADALISEIRDGRWRKGDKLPAEGELGKRFGVNKLTANKAVGILVGQGYCRRSRGRGGTVVAWEDGGFKGAIGCFQGHTLSYFWEMLRGAQQVALARGYLVQYFGSPGAQGGPPFERRLARSGILGLLAVQTRFNGLPFPVVSLDNRPKPGEDWEFVDCDQYEAGRLLARHLLDQGHRRIVFVSHALSGFTGPRADGFHDALTEAGIKDAESRIVRTTFETAQSPVILDRIFATWPKVTAIAYDCDPPAAHAIWMLLERGRRVPEDVSVAGIGNVTEFHRPHRITTVDQHPFEVGARAAELLLDRIEGRRPEPIRDVIPVHLVPGSTVRKLRR